MVIVFPNPLLKILLNTIRTIPITCLLLPPHFFCFHIWPHIPLSSVMVFPDFSTLLCGRTLRGFIKIRDPCFPASLIKFFFIPIWHPHKAIFFIQIVQTVSYRYIARMPDTYIRTFFPFHSTYVFGRLETRSYPLSISHIRTTLIYVVLCTTRWHCLLKLMTYFSVSRVCTSRSDIPWLSMSVSSIVKISIGAFEGRQFSTLTNYVSFSLQCFCDLFVYPICITSRVSLRRGGLSKFLFSTTRSHVVFVFCIRHR